MKRRTKKFLATALTAGMLMGVMSTPVAAATAEWKKDSTGWWYQNTDGTYPKNKWENINGIWYHFDNRGYMSADKWIQDKDGTWYYVDATGAMRANCWKKGNAGEWYYLAADGAMKVNSWVKDSDGAWYYLGTDGVMKTDAMITEKSGISYYVDSKGVMVTNKWVQDKAGKSYYMGSDGAMIINEEGRSMVGDITFKMPDSWQVVLGSQEAIIYANETDSNQDGNVFMALIAETEQELENVDLELVQQMLQEQYKQEKVVLVSESIIDTPCGKALDVTIDATDSMQSMITNNNRVYARQVFIVNKDTIYAFQMICAKGNFGAAQECMNEVIASVSK